MNALRHELLAGAALPDDEDRGLARRALRGKLAHAAPGAVACECLMPVSRGGAPLPLVGAQVAVRALDHRRVAAHEQRAGDLAAFHDRRAPDHQRTHADLQHLLGRGLAQAQRGAEVQHGLHFAQHAARQFLDGGSRSSAMTGFSASMRCCKSTATTPSCSWPRTVFSRSWRARSARLWRARWMAS